MRPTKRRDLPPPLALGLLLLVGCGGGNEYQQVAEVATQAADRQAQQNNELARLNREIAEGTRRMVEADAEARKDLMAAQAQLQAERNAITQGFDKLEVERQQMAEERQRQSLLAPALETTAFAVVAALVIGFCVLLLLGLRRQQDSDDELNALLIRELVSDEPRLLIGGPVQAASPEQIDEPALPAPADKEPNEQPDK